MYDLEDMSDYVVKLKHCKEVRSKIDAAKFVNSLDCLVYESVNLTTINLHTNLGNIYYPAPLLRTATDRSS
eukprot:SAG31_NODE_14397_length_809_cov_1.273239_2_plen_71_part_00